MTLEIITHPALEGIRHGFFTRKGGASSGVYAGLNCGGSSKDLNDAVATNRARVAEAMGLAPEAVVTVYQTHSADVVEVSGPFPGARPEADAMVSRNPGVGLAILTADCGPVLFADAEAGVIGAAHAGWKGALTGVLDATVAGMVRLGAVRGRITAVIGPTISGANYEVGPDFVDRFLREDPRSAGFFTPGAGDRSLFDLPAYNRFRLEQTGIGAAQWTGDCTYADDARFFSYRRSVHRGEPDYGRLISVIRL